MSAFRRLLRAAAARLQQPVDAWIVGVIGWFAIGAFLRVFNFWVPELWLDEYGTWWAVAPERWTDVVRRTLAVGSTSPLYYLVVKLFVLSCGGAGPWSLRLPSVLFGLGTLAMAYPLGLQIFRDRRAAVLSLAVFAVSEPLIWYSQEARPHALALLGTVLSFFFYLRLLEAERRAHRVGYLLATALAYYAHYLFGFIVMIQLAHLLVVGGRRSPQVLGRWLATFLILGLLALPGGLQLLSMATRRESMDYLSPISFQKTLAVVAELLDARVFSLVAFALLLIGWEQGRPRIDEQRPRRLLSLWLLLPIICFWLLPSFFEVTLLRSADNKHFSRHILFVLPAALFTMAWLLARARRVAWRTWVPVSVFVVLSFVWHLMPHVAVFKTFTSWPVEGFSDAGAALSASMEPDDFLLFRSGYAEADLFATSWEKKAVLVSAAKWPLLVHLRPEQAERIRLLPFRATAQTGAYLDTLLRGAAEHRRVWVVGIMGQSIDYAVEQLRGSEGYRLTGQMASGAVVCLLLERQHSD